MVSKNGLTMKQVEESKAKNGTNQLSSKPKESLLSMFLGNFKDIWIIVLCVALGIKVALTVVSMIFPELSGGNDAIEILSILAAIMLATGLGTISEYRNTSRSEKLQEEYNKTFAKVMREGKLVNIPTSEIVKGDVVLVQAGDKIPVDGLVIDGSVKVSQAAINGEFRDETKTATVSMDEADSTDYKSEHKVFMGSVVTSGESYMTATVIGDDSELGKINKSLNSNDEEERMDASSLKLAVVAKSIGKLGVSAAAIVGVMQVILSIMRFDGVATPMNYALWVAEAVMLMASIVIMAVPEGLPMMNNMVQAMNSESLYKKNIMVSHNAAFSDSAYMDLLFSDKTGTISQGILSLVEFILGNGKIVNHVNRFDFIEAITLNNLAKVSEGKPIGSNNMDRALLGYALNNGFSEGMLDREKVQEMSGFDSEKKCATVLMKDGTTYWKGATEGIIDKVTHYVDDEGDEQVFTPAMKTKLEEVMVEQAKRTMKLLSVAKLEGDKVILYAVLCLRDNVRADAAETVQILDKAGIQTVMVTGDMEETAVAIAKEAHILKDPENDIVLTHEELESMSDEELKEKLPHLRVVSRAKPLDKKRLVSVAQSMDRVVGMTGDGVNDSPALKQADVGFAMGDGTAVAQEAGDVVILNNSLTSIKDCVLNSRTMAKSVSKFLIFQLTVNVSTLLINILAPILGWMEPFSIVSILWINLIMDTLAALAFGGEPILDRYMNEKPVKKSAPILTKYIKSAIASSSIFITLGAILILENVGGILDFVRPENCADVAIYDRTVMFAFFIYSVIFNSLNTRSTTLNVFEHIGQNKKFIGVMSGIFIMQTLLLEFGGQVFNTAPLTAKGYLVTIAMALLILPFDAIRKMIANKINKK